MYVKWTTCQPGEWQGLEASIPDDPEMQGVKGVYIIWHGGPMPRVVCVGQGDIKDQLRTQLADPEIRTFEIVGLFVAWAEVPSSARNGVEAYLARCLWPEVDRGFPNVRPIEVNLPW